MRSGCCVNTFPLPRHEDRINESQNEWWGSRGLIGTMSQAYYTELASSRITGVEAAEMYACEQTVAFTSPQEAVHSPTGIEIELVSAESSKPGEENEYAEPDILLIEDPALT